LSVDTLRRPRPKGILNPNFGVKERPWLEGDQNPLRRRHQDNPGFGESQRGEANPVPRVRHLYEDPSYVSRITRGIRKHTQEKKGKTYEEVYGPDKAREYRQKLREASPARMAKFFFSEELNQKLEAQHPLGYYTVDGDFWHANPSLYSPDKLSERQRIRRRLDASCDSFLRNRGYGVLRLWESDLRDRRDFCRDLVITSVEELSHGKR